MSGILDPKGKNNNPLTGKPYSDEYKKLADIWSKFPAYEDAENTIKTIEKNQVILITSGTGSGKTVLLPKYVLHVFDYKSNVAITLPKQIVAKSAAEFGAKTLDVKLGEEVGYQYKGSPKEAKSEKTKLLYATDGTIVARLLKDPELSDFDAVVIDEAHERKVQIDFLLYLLRETLKLRPNFKLVIMSATINIDIFKKYYADYKFKHIDIGGKTNYPIKSIFLENRLDYDEALEKGYDIMLDILAKDDPAEEGAHDIIFFVTSKNEEISICNRLQKDIEQDSQNTCKISCNGGVYCVEVYSGMSAKKEELAKHKDKYKSLGRYTRKVVMATPAAESSLTIDGIKYVIDLGYELLGSYDPQNMARRLDRVMISHAQAKQRMGRTGRTGPGICYHLYTKEDFDTNMDRYPQPAIRVNDITGDCLRLLAIDKVNSVDNLRDILDSFIEPPKDAYINTAITQLKRLALISNEITPLGRLVSNITSDPQAGLAIVLSKLYNCSHETIKIMTICDIIKNNISKIISPPQLSKNIDKHAKKKILERYDKAKKRFKHKYGDHLSLLKIYEAFEKKDDKKVDKWCYDNFLNCSALKKCKKYISRTKRRLRQANFDDLNIEIHESIKQLDIADRVMSCILGGYSMNTASRRLGNKKFYRTQQQTDLNIKISRDSFITDNPQHILYSELFILMGDPDLNIVSKISNMVINALNY